jgi:nucleotide-binding universal stress UspA family protein
MASIVAGTDGSESASRAIVKAGELARALDCTVHVVSCYREGSNGAWMAAAGGLTVGDVMSSEDARVHAEQAVERACSQLSELGVSAQGHVCSGEPAQALVTIADGEKAEMIVVGNRGMSGARRVLGSVPNRVSHHARCGVLIVPTT